MIIPSKVKLIMLAVAVVGAFVAGVKVESWRNDAGVLAATKALDEYTQTMDEKVESLNVANANARLELNKANQLLKQERAIERQMPIYTECTVPSSGVQLYNRTTQGLTSPASGG